MRVLHLLKNIEIALGANKDPPTEFRIFAYGETETEHGTYKFDRAAGEAILARFKKRGVDAGGDYEHASLSDPPPAEGAPSPMWYQLELRDDGLWATDVKWTPRATEYLKNSEYRYLSPAFLADKKTGAVVKFINVALTNYPATHDIPALVAASAMPARDLRVTSLSAMSFDQIRAELDEALRRMLAPDGLYGWICDVYDDSLVYSVNGELYQAPYTLEDGEAEIGTPIEVQRTYTPVPNGDAGEETKTMKNLLTALMLKDTASEADALVALAAERKARDDAETELIKLTGAKSRSDAIGTIAAWKASAEQAEKLSAKVKELEGAAQAAEVEKLVSEGSRDGKIPPSMKDWATDLGKKDLVALKSFIEKAPKLVTTTEDGGKKPNKDETVLVELTAEEKAEAKKLRIPEQKFAEQKARNAQLRGGAPAPKQ